MTPKDYAALLEYIFKNNSWGIDMYEIVNERNRRAIKYVESSFDCRDGRIWQITFKQIIASSASEATHSFRIECPDDIKKIYKWLDDEVK